MLIAYGFSIKLLQITAHTVYCTQEKFGRKNFGKPYR